MIRWYSTVSEPGSPSVYFRLDLLNTPFKDSGDGGQMPDEDGDEEDGFDECTSGSM